MTVPVTVQTTRRVVLWKGGQDVRPRAAFTAGQAVGYNAHHEGVRYVARCAAVAAAKIRGPPAANR